MKNKNAVYLNKIFGYEHIAAALEKTSSVEAWNSYWNPKGSNYTAHSIIPPIVALKSKHDIKPFFDNLEELTDDEMKFVMCLELQFNSLSLNDTSRNITEIKNLKKNPYEGNKSPETIVWVYSVGFIQFGIIMQSREADHTVLMNRQIRNKVFPNSLKRFVEECRVLISPKPEVTDDGVVRDQEELKSTLAYMMKDVANRANKKYEEVVDAKNDF